MSVGVGVWVLVGDGSFEGVMVTELVATVNG